MKITRLGNALATLAVFFSATALSAAQSPAGPLTTTRSAKVRIALAGDSTVTDDAGWGRGFANCFNDDVQVINFSRGGRSSKSFIREGLWQKVLDLKPDYVLIQFGHNDQPGHPGDRETDPQTTYKQFMTQYVEEARAAGIKPVLVTSLSRRQWSDDGAIHSTLVPYVEVVKQLAADKHVPLIDLHARSIELYEKLGKQAVLELSPMKKPDKKPDSDTPSTQAIVPDGTHLNAKGSDVVGPIVAQELKKVVPELAAYVGAKTMALTVATDGSGDFKTIQEAVAAAPQNSATRVVIHIKPGIYQGPIIVPRNKPNLTVEGDDAATTSITWSFNVNDPIPPGSDKFNPGVQILGDDFHASNLTFENTSGDHGQALALRVDSDRIVFNHCRILGWQDTLMVNNGRHYFKDCHIEGRVDFIYGSATAIFDHCEIHSKNGGHITAASTAQDRPFGLVFLNCKLTGDATPWNPAATNPATTEEAKKPNKMADLGRPWRPYASVTYINCEMGDHIKPQGWDNWRNPANEKTARYAEYSSTGPGANPPERAPWSKQLTDADAANYTIENILGGSDHWNPTADAPPPPLLPRR